MRFRRISLMLQLRPGTKLKDLLIQLALASMLPLVVLFPGCGNSCFTSVSNPGGGIGGAGGGNASSGCGARIPLVFTGVTARVTGECASCSNSNQIQRVFVTLSGIEFHPKVSVGEAPSDWQELFPLLAIEPRQFALQMAAPNGPAVNLTGEQATLPAGVYDQVRLRLDSGGKGAGDLLAAQNGCGKTGLNCVVMADGRILPLILRDDLVDLPISSGTTSEGVFVALPETANQLSIELRLVWTLVTPPGQSAQLLPVLTGSASIGQELTAGESHPSMR
jgi:Domain of unknown function (DUF4382)